jgi:4-hydroxy-2-oxoheptanedioate aldolase
MRQNRLKQLWANGAAAVNGWLAIPSSFSAEVMSHAGWDSVTIDLQHGLIDYQTAVTMLQAISTTETVPLARVPWLEEGILMKMLDAGCMGLICPMINSGTEAERFVSACRYAPRGRRSVGPIRASIYAGNDYIAHANEEIVLLAMVETVAALNQLDDILSVPGLDGVYVGPADLALSMGVPPGFDPVNKDVRDAIATIVSRTRAKGLMAGIHCGAPSVALERIGDGYQFVSLGSDSRLLATGAAAVVSEMRAGLASEAKARKPRKNAGGQKSSPAY